MVITQLAPFAAKWTRYRLNDEDLAALEAELMERPERGAVMAGAGGLRKLRFAPPSWHTGRSGATRVCYAWLPRYDRLYLITLFTKNEQANLPPAERATIAKVLRRIEAVLAKGDWRNA
jgi:hypothetical protein